MIDYQRLSADRDFLALFDEGGPVAERVAQLEKLILSSNRAESELTVARARREGLLEVKAIVDLHARQERAEQLEEQVRETTERRTGILQRAGLQDIWRRRAS